MPSAKFTAQLIAMVTPEMKADIVGTARARDVSVSEEVRDRLDRAKRAGDPTIYPDADTEQDAREEQVRQRQPRVSDEELDERFREHRIGRAARDSTRP